MWTSWSSNFSLTFSSYGLEIKLCLASSSTIVNYYYFIRLLLPIWLFLLDLFAVCVCVCAYLVSHVWLFATPWTVAHQAPLSMGFPRKMVSCHFLLQGIFPTQTQRLNQCLLHWWADSLPVSHLLLLLLLSRFSRVRLCASPKTAAQPGSPVPGILQARHWNELPFPSPMHESEKCEWSLSVEFDS